MEPDNFSSNCSSSLLVYQDNGLQSVISSTCRHQILTVCSALTVVSPCVINQCNIVINQCNKVIIQ